MKDNELLNDLLEAETEAEAVAALEKKGLMGEKGRWRYLGGMHNNQSIVNNQQSSQSAALVEKFTNAVDAILLRHCKEQGIDPRGPKAPQSMSAALELFVGDLAGMKGADVRQFAEENIVLYATGTKATPSLSLYDAGEGQLAENFQKTFCSLISASDEGSYKGAIPFVQGRFNMGGTGVLPYCGEKYKLQLVLSRVPNAVAKTKDHEWAFTIFCFFESKQDPSWRYLVGTDEQVLTAGCEPLALVPKVAAKAGELCNPRERLVKSGTLIKMYDYRAPRSNICGEQFKKIGEYLLRPALPLRMMECRPEYKANVMGVNVWNRLSAWGKDKLEEGFEEGASISIELSTGETVPAEIRVFKAMKDSDDEENQPQTGLRALINGQSHAKRDANFFRTKAVNKEHIAGSMLVTLDCTALGQGSRNALFMSNRETFRDDQLLAELLKKIQGELSVHEGLEQLNRKRYEEKVKDAVDDEEGISAIEELLSTDPALADLFGSTTLGKVAAKTATNGSGGTVDGTPEPFSGLEFPTFFHRKDKSISAEVCVPQGSVTSVSFLTDVKNNYFARYKHRGIAQFIGELKPTFHLFNGRLTLKFTADKSIPIGTKQTTEMVITDNQGSGPFKLKFNVLIDIPKGPAEPKLPQEPTAPPDPKVQAGPSRPDIKEADKGPDEPPLKIEKHPTSGRLQIVINKTSKLLDEAKMMCIKEDEPAVAFVFKYGLALAAMGLLDSAKKTKTWEENDVACREQIEETARGIARVIVPLCLSLPKKLPKKK